MTLIAHFLKKTNSVFAEQHFICELCTIVVKTQISVAGRKAHLKDFPFRFLSQEGPLAMAEILPHSILCARMEGVQTCLSDFLHAAPFFSFQFLGRGIMKQNQKPCVTFIDLCADVSRI